MADEWCRVALGDLIEIKHGFAFQGDYFRDQPPGDLLLTPGNFAIGGGFKLDKLKYYDGPVLQEFVLAEGDLIVTMTDLSRAADTLGYPASVPKSLPDHRFLHNQRLGRIKLKSARLDMKYLYYLMCSPKYRQEIIASATGTTVKHTSPSRIQAFRFELPGLDEQHAIASLLGALDDKIELSRKMSATLEAMARAIFKSWFVDFDPVRAKAEGRRPEGMEDATAALFPDRFGEDGLPEGWRRESLDNLAVFLNGLALQKYPPKGSGDLPVIKIAQLRAGSSSGADLASGDLPADYVVRDGDLLFSWSGSLMQRVWTGGIGALNQHLFKVTPINRPKWLCYLWIDQHLPEFQAIASSKATTMGHIQRHHLKEASCILPPAKLLKRANEFINPLFERSIACALECRTLASLRDTLLPALISGRLRLADAGRILDATS